MNDFSFAVSKTILLNQNKKLFWDGSHNNQTKVGILKAAGVPGKSWKFGQFCEIQKQKGKWVGVDGCDETGVKPSLYSTASTGSFITIQSPIAVDF